MSAPPSRSLSSYRPQHDHYCASRECGYIWAAGECKGEKCGCWRDHDLHYAGTVDGHAYVQQACSCGLAAALLREQAQQVNDEEKNHARVAPASAPRHESDHRVDQWQPIESAPRDGTKILIAHAFDDSICISYWGCIRGHYGWKSLLHNSASGSQGDFCHDIAGWMPLPAPPEAK